MSRGRNRRKGITSVAISLRLEDPTYRKLLQIKIAMKNNQSMNNYLNSIIVRYASDNSGVLVSDDKIDYSEFD